MKDQSIIHRLFNDLGPYTLPGNPLNISYKEIATLEGRTMEKTVRIEGVRLHLTEKERHHGPRSSEES